MWWGGWIVRPFITDSTRTRRRRPAEEEETNSAFDFGPPANLLEISRRERHRAGWWLAALLFYLPVGIFVGVFLAVVLGYILAHVLAWF
jgi:hypothetical protein